MNSRLGLVLVLAGPVVADSNIFDSIGKTFNSLFRSYGELGPTLVPYNVTLRNTKFIYRTINREPAAGTLVWPSKEIKKQSGEDAWGKWKPQAGMNASVIYGWGSGKKWLLHFVEDNKYMVVRDPCISRSWKQGKQYWYDHHVHRWDPRHIDNINRRAKQQTEKENKDGTKPAGGGSCGGGGGKPEMPPVWVLGICAVLLVVVIWLGGTALYARTPQLMAEQQPAGQSSEEKKKEVDKGTKAPKSQKERDMKEDKKAK